MLPGICYRRPKDWTMIKGNALLLSAKPESFKDDEGNDREWLDVAVMIGGEVIKGSGSADCLDLLNGDREALDAGQPIPVTFRADLRQADNYGRRFKFRFTEFVGSDEV